MKSNGFWATGGRALRRFMVVVSGDALAMEPLGISECERLSTKGFMVHFCLFQDGYHLFMVVYDLLLTRDRFELEVGE